MSAQRLMAYGSIAVEMTNVKTPTNVKNILTFVVGLATTSVKIADKC